MNKHQLIEILQLLDNKKITDKLKELGYEDCETSTNEAYQNVSILDILNGNEIETDWYENVFDDREYQGNVYTNVKGFADNEFIFIQINKINRETQSSFPERVEIYTKTLHK